jgi:hypothetical protein
MDNVGFAALRPAFAAALEKKGFKELTSVQHAVLDPELEGRDLRITSQTGSGKTIAIGLVVADLVTGEKNTKSGVAKPKVMVVAPTRELAKQVEDELAWLFEAIGASVTSVTGGASVRDERRALALGPEVIVGTPGRLLDHLTRGIILRAGASMRATSAPSCSTRPIACSISAFAKTFSPSSSALRKNDERIWFRPRSHVMFVRSPIVFSAIPRTSKAPSSAPRTPTSST